MTGEEGDQQGKHLPVATSYREFPWLCSEAPFNAASILESLGSLPQWFGTCEPFVVVVVVVVVVIIIIVPHWLFKTLSWSQLPYGDCMVQKQIKNSLLVLEISSST